MRLIGLGVIALGVGLVVMPVWASPLHDAARAGDVAAVERLVAAGANIDAQDEAVLTPLILAALGGHKEIVVLLIAKGADPGGRDGNGFTPLHAAAHAGHIEIVKFLVGQNVDVNDQQNEPKITPLHAAAERDRRDVAAFLLAKGADVDLRADDGKTPAFMATLKAHTAMLILLREHGAACSTIRSAKFRGICMNAGS